MGSADEANYVISVLNDTEFDGRPLNVRIDQKPEKPAGGGRSGGGGGKGGGKRGGACGLFPIPCRPRVPLALARHAASILHHGAALS